MFSNHSFGDPVLLYTFKMCLELVEPLLLDAGGPIYPADFSLPQLLKAHTPGQSWIPNCNSFLTCLVYFGPLTARSELYR